MQRNPEVTSQAPAVLEHSGVVGVVSQLLTDLVTRNDQVRFLRHLQRQNLTA